MHVCATYSLLLCCMPITSLASCAALLVYRRHFAVCSLDVGGAWTSAAGPAGVGSSSHEHTVPPPANKRAIPAQAAEYRHCNAT